MKRVGSMSGNAPPPLGDLTFTATSSFGSGQYIPDINDPLANSVATSSRQKRALTPLKGSMRGAEPPAMEPEMEFDPALLQGSVKPNVFDVLSDNSGLANAPKSKRKKKKVPRVQLNAEIDALYELVGAVCVHITDATLHKVLQRPQLEQHFAAIDVNRMRDCVENHRVSYGDDLLAERSNERKNERHNTSVSPDPGRPISSMEGGKVTVSDKFKDMFDRISDDEAPTNNEGEKESDWVNIGDEGGNNESCRRYRNVCLRASPSASGGVRWRRKAMGSDTARSGSQCSSVSASPNRRSGSSRRTSLPRTLAPVDPNTPAVPQKKSTTSQKRPKVARRVSFAGSDCEEPADGLLSAGRVVDFDPDTQVNGADGFEHLVPKTNKVLPMTSTPYVAPQDEGSLGATEMGDTQAASPSTCLAHQDEIGCHTPNMEHPLIDTEDVTVPIEWSPNTQELCADAIAPIMPKTPQDSRAENRVAAALPETPDSSLRPAASFRGRRPIA